MITAEAARKRVCDLSEEYHRCADDADRIIRMLSRNQVRSVSLLTLSYPRFRESFKKLDFKHKAKFCEELRRLGYTVVHYVPHNALEMFFRAESLTVSW